MLVLYTLYPDGIDESQVVSAAAEPEKDTQPAELPEDSLRSKRKKPLPPSEPAPEVISHAKKAKKASALETSESETSVPTEPVANVPVSENKISTQSSSSADMV